MENVRNYLRGNLDQEGVCLPHRDNVHAFDHALHGHEQNPRALPTRWKLLAPSPGTSFHCDRSAAIERQCAKEYAPRRGRPSFLAVLATV